MFTIADSMREKRTKGIYAETRRLKVTKNSILGVDVNSWGPHLNSVLSKSFKEYYFVPPCLCEKKPLSKPPTYSKRFVTCDLSLELVPSTSYA